MSIESLLTLIIGFLLGSFSSFAIARLQKFTDLRAQAKRVVLEIDFMGSGSQIDFPRSADAAELVFISCELQSYGHHRAAESLSLLASEINLSIFQASNRQIDISEFSALNAKWQRIISRIKPSKFRLFSLMPSL
jgi:hypothetical protein